MTQEEIDKIKCCPQCTKWFDGVICDWEAKKLGEEYFKKYKQNIDNQQKN